MSSAGSPNVLGKLSYVLASRQREKVLAAVVPRPQTPGQIAKQTGLHLSHVSRTLGELSRTDLITCHPANAPGKCNPPPIPATPGSPDLPDPAEDQPTLPMA